MEAKIHAYVIIHIATLQSKLEDIKQEVLRTSLFLDLHVEKAHLKQKLMAELQSRKMELKNEMVREI